MPIKNYQIKSKATVAYVLQCDPETSMYLPATEILDQSTFRYMVQKCDTVYLKPDRGRQSMGIIRVDHEKKGGFRLRSSDKEKTWEFATLSALWSTVSRMTSDARYIIQQGIKSVTKDQRPFDFRCHALRIHGKWVVGGICVRLGPPGSFVTTSHRGGTPVLTETFFPEYLHYSAKEQRRVMNRLHDCVLKTVNVISRIYPRNWEFAVDIGLDEEKRLWVYEVNIEPLIRGNFKLLPDKKLYNKICSLRRIAK